MLYEKKISSFPQLIRELDIIDLDAGIRAVGKYKASKCLVFVTRSASGFTALLYNTKRAGKESIPNKRLLAKDFATVKDLESFLAGVVVKPVVASEY